VGQPLLSALARSNLGYLEARAGNLVDASVMLQEATSSFAKLEASSFVLETKARQAEVAALRRDADSALALAAEVLGDAGDAAEMTALQSTLHRVKAAALSLKGDADAAGGEADKAIELARRGSATFQLALALDVLALIDDDLDAAAESEELLGGLGVQRLARPPLES
jgi:hypothetical protein